MLWLTCLTASKDLRQFPQDCPYARGEGPRANLYGFPPDISFKADKSSPSTRSIWMHQSLAMKLHRWL